MGIVSSPKKDLVCPVVFRVSVVGPPSPVVFCFVAVIKAWVQVVSGKSGCKTLS